jgi:hypothetical protein
MMRKKLPLKDINDSGGLSLNEIFSWVAQFTHARAISRVDSTPMETLYQIAVFCSLTFILAQYALN